MSWLGPESFREVRQRYRHALKETLWWFLEDEGEAERVTAGAFEQTERQWKAIEGEANVLSLLAQAAVDQCERLLPRPWNQISRRIPTVYQIEANLIQFRFEQRVAAMRTMLEAMRASIREAGRDPAADTDLNELEAGVERLVAQYYNQRLPWDDGENPLGGGALCPVMPPDPMRGPGGGRTFAEALAPARNP